MERKGSREICDFTTAINTGGACRKPLGINVAEWPVNYYISQRVAIKFYSMVDGLRVMPSAQLPAVVGYSAVLSGHDEAA